MPGLRQRWQDSLTAPQAWRCRRLIEESKSALRGFLHREGDSVTARPNCTAVMPVKAAHITAKKQRGIPTVIINTLYYIYIKVYIIIYILNMFLQIHLVEAMMACFFAQRTRRRCPNRSDHGGNVTAALRAQRVPKCMVTGEEKYSTASLCNQSIQ